MFTHVFLPIANVTKITLIVNQTCIGDNRLAESIDVITALIDISPIHVREGEVVNFIRSPLP
jgi:hypothetical protein